LSEKSDYEQYLRWKTAKQKKQSHRFRNFILLLIVALTLWFVLDKKSFLAFFEWLIGLF